MISYDGVQSLLKQKSPFTYVDKVLQHEKGKKIISLKNVTGSDFFSALHFPDNSIYPGIYIIESIAQTTAILCTLETSDDDNKDIQFWALGGIQRFNFLSPVRPGDTLIIEVYVVKFVQHMAIVSALVRVEDRVVAEGQLTFGAVKNEKY